MKNESYLKISIRKLARDGTDVTILYSIFEMSTNFVNGDWVRIDFDSVLAILSDWTKNRLRKAVNGLFVSGIVNLKKKLNQSDWLMIKKLDDDLADPKNQNLSRVCDRASPDKRKTGTKRKTSSGSTFLDHNQNQIESIKKKTKAKEKVFFFDVFSEIEKNSPRFAKINPQNFEILWKLYPGKKGSKAAAKLEFMKRINLPDCPSFETMLKAIEEQKKSDQWKAGYIPHCRRWIKEGRWIDQASDLATYGQLNEPEMSGIPYKEKTIKKIIKTHTNKGVADLASVILAASKLLKIWDTQQKQWRIKNNGQEEKQMKKKNIPKHKWKKWPKICEMIPTGAELLSMFIQYLDSVETINKINKHLFKQANGFLLDWIEQTQIEIGYDVMTGERYHGE